ncbi:MAG TPA: hypothetical protein QGF95_27465 [Candidatus Latescibacteria bacterium]|jgi:hypothetical protein|nr:hypothetical protein [Candidatus Latescibacterota bacterium]HJP34303.1 hypothetical protein [Candidatus Latescibacterota bacterium]|tara:strand:- start:232 stop:399 length:168 start_codon:yes stop_codon:yes gene_type:complete
MTHRILGAILCNLLFVTAGIATPPVDSDKFVKHLEFDDYECEVDDDWIRPTTASN